MRPVQSPVLVLFLVLGVSVALLLPATSQAQRPERSSSPIEQVSTSDTGEAFVLTLSDAVRIALENNFDLRGAQLDVREADAQVREAWGSLYPSLDLTGDFTRNVVTANPFAGSDITNFFGGGNETDWVAFNERRRLDTDPATEPIPFPSFVQRQEDSLAASGVSLSTGSNPFSVDNEFRGGLQLTQTLYSKQAFTSVKGAQQFKDVSRHARDRQVQLATNDVVTAFFEALLAQERTRVLRQSVNRARQTLQEVSMQVQRGVMPKAQRLGAEVEVSNARTQLIQARNTANLARDNLKRVMGLSPEQAVELEGDLETQKDDGLQQISLETISMSRAVDRALENRPDLERAQLNVELRKLQTEVSRAEFFPRVEAVANFTYSGRVPDDRSRILTTDPQDPTNPFFFREQERGFFHDDFWNPSLNVGLQLTWNIFNGFQSSSRLQQAQIQRQRAELQRDRLRQTIELEVRRAIRDLENARQRIQAQQTTVRRAETNYNHMQRRVSEGVASQLELREASEQLDQSRLNYLQAVHDYVVARSNLETALGESLTPTSESYLMTRR